MAPHRRHAFTVIELLIVIAIMAILFSIGVPAIVKASNRAAEAKCMSNLRGTLQATAAYVSDNRQTFPGLGSNGTPYNQLRMINLYGKRGVYGGPGAVPTEDRPLFDYLNGETSVAECPLDKGSSAAPPSIGTTNFEYFGSSYAYPDRLSYRYSYGRYDIWSIEGHKLTKVQQPSKKMVLSDLSFFTSGTAEQDQWHEPINGAQAAALAFVDGHVAVTAAKTPIPTSTWSQYLYGNGLTYKTAAQIETWARLDPYY